MIRVAILTASDKAARGEREDESGKVISEMLTAIGEVVLYRIVPDDIDEILEELRRMADRHKVDLILTTGGTGLGPRDFTPEATKAVIDREVPGIMEAMRARSLEKTPLAMLSRGVAGTRGRTLIINLPGSPKAVRECIEVILPALPHAIEVLQGRAQECARQYIGQGDEGATLSR